MKIILFPHRLDLRLWWEYVAHEECRFTLSTVSIPDTVWVLHQNLSIESFQSRTYSMVKTWDWPLNLDIKSLQVISLWGRQTCWVYQMSTLILPLACRFISINMKQKIHHSSVIFISFFKCSIHPYYLQVSIEEDLKDSREVSKYQHSWLNLN